MKDSVVKKLFKNALKTSVPVFFGYTAIGIAFGLMVVKAGYPWWLSLCMGLILFTGTGQYFAVGLFASGAGLGEFLLVQFLLSIRHFFYGLSLIDKYKGAGKFKPYMMYAITDETFALVQSTQVPDVRDLYGEEEDLPDENKVKALFYTMISALDHSYWLLGSVIGAVACTILEKYGLSSILEGVDFALTALFIVIVMDQIKNRKNWLSTAVGFCVAIVTVVLYKLGLFDSSNIIWVSICFGLGAMLMVKGPSYFGKKGEKVNG